MLTKGLAGLGEPGVWLRGKLCVVCAVWWREGKWRESNSSVNGRGKGVGTRRVEWREVRGAFVWSRNYGGKI